MAPRVLAGCTAMGVVGGGHEVEQRAAISLVAAHLPGVEVHATWRGCRDLPDEDAPPASWRAWSNLPARDAAAFVLLADPFTCPIERVVAGLDYAFPEATKVGGLASGGARQGENVLFLNEHRHREGMILVGMRGNLAVDAIVAQGCRPIGRPLTVSSCTHNVLLELEGHSPVAYLQELLPTLPETDQKLAETSLFLGLQVESLDAPQSERRFLIRNLVGLDYGNGALAVGAPLEEGMVVQFHLRDRRTSADDLGVLLRRHAGRSLTPAAGALLFSCMGRGAYLYGRPDHDTQLFRQVLGDMPLGGFFCNGEIGPVGPTTYVHGYTSSFGIFRPAAPAP